MQLSPEVVRPVSTLLREVFEGPPANAAYILNGGDPGLLGTLDRLSAADASKPGTNGSSIASHVDHIRYGFSLMNRWIQGEDPYGTADWGASWKIGPVSPADWDTLRHQLRDELTRWQQALTVPREVDEVELTGIISGVAHAAYHLGAIRQLSTVAAGPRHRP